MGKHSSETEIKIYLLFVISYAYFFLQYSMRIPSIQRKIRWLIVPFIVLPL